MFYFFLLFLNEKFYFLFTFFYFFIKNLIAWGGQDSLKFWKVRISKKNTSLFFFLQFCSYLRYDYKAIIGQNELIDFSRNPDPFFDGLTHFYENQLICSLIFSKTIWILLKTIAKKVNFPT